ncbi:MAG: hypothetical protein EBZ48_09020 [Proteobacteria bacterium]|nr:hypothetical protein [Pseudomonadota bacterium]
MCPLCWAALVAQVVFYITLGVFLVVITDLKVGLPLSLVTLSMAAGNMWGWWSAPNWMLYVLGAMLLVRGFWVLAKHEHNWVRRLALKIGGWLKRKLRPLVYGS